MPVAGGPPPIAARPRPAVRPPQKPRRTGLLPALVVLAVLIAAFIGLWLVKNNNANNAAPSQPSTGNLPQTSAASSGPLSSPTSSDQSATGQQTSSAPTTSTGPSSTPASTPAAGVTGAQLARAITDYYGLLPSNTDQAWSRLTKKYQKSTAKNRKNYQDFWDAIGQVDVSNAVGSPPDSAQATITYHYKNGKIVVEQTSYGLVQQDGMLKIDSSQVQASQTQ
jgi:cytoskeletal protein RodZ